MHCVRKLLFWKSLLLKEAKNGNEFEVKCLLEGGDKNVDVQDKEGKTPLMLTMEGFHDETIKVLFKFSPNIHLKNKSGKSALQMACKLSLSNKKIVGLFWKVLKEECCNDSKKLAVILADNGCPLYLAMLLEDATVMRVMLEKGCAVDDKDPHTLKTALHEAVALRNFESIKVLVEYGADVNAMDSRGNIPFTYYNFFDDSEEELDMIRSFVGRNISWTTLNHGGFMQVWLAIARGKKEVLRILLRSNIDWCATDDILGFSLIFYLVLNETSDIAQDVFDELRGKNIYEKADDRTKFEALSFASTHHATKIVELLLDSGVDPNVQDHDKSTALFVVSQFNGSSDRAMKNKETFILLLERGADVQIHAEANQTVFYNIIRNRNVHLAESALGQLAINETHGTPVIDTVRNAINSQGSLEDQYLLCKAQLEELKQTNFFRSITLFELLNAREKTIVAYARNQEFFEKLTSVEHFSNNSYYDYIIQSKFKKTIKIVRLRKSITCLVCKIMKIHYGSYAVIVDKITDYVIS